MAVPSVVKITRKGITFTSSVDRANYSMRELTRAAMKDVGRIIVKFCRDEVRGWNKLLASGGFKKYSRANRYQYWVRSKENDLIVGMENTKYGAVSAWWADQAELGTNHQPKRAILHTVVMNHIQEIVKVESKYLAYMEDEAKALAMINEEEAQE